MKIIKTFILLNFLVLISCNSEAKKTKSLSKMDNNSNIESNMENQKLDSNTASDQVNPKTITVKGKKIEISGELDIATFGEGCFWCSEALFDRLEGVYAVKSGYGGGHVKNPSYKEVCNGTTGHAEGVQIYYDPKKITFDELLQVFWSTHDPTTLNRQGNDRGTQYRSVVFYHNENQKELALKYKKELGESKIYPDPIVTEITPFTNFFEAEDYHDDYYKLNGSEPYCQFVVRPKVEKFEKVFKNKLKH